MLSGGKDGREQRGHVFQSRRLHLRRPEQFDGTAARPGFSGHNLSKEGQATHAAGISVRTAGVRPSATAAHASTKGHDSNCRSHALRSFFFPVLHTLHMLRAPRRRCQVTPHCQPGAHVYAKQQELSKRRSHSQNWECAISPWWPYVALAVLMILNVRPARTGAGSRPNSGLPDALHKHGGTAINPVS